MNEQQFKALPLDQRKAHQQRLQDLGLYAGKLDGNWGAGTAAAFDGETKRISEEAERARRGRIDEESASAAAEVKRAEAATKRTAAEEETRKTKAREERNRQASSPEGIATQIGATVGAPLAGVGVGRAMGMGTSYLMDRAQESKNRMLAGAAQDRVAGLTTREGARSAVRLSGALPSENAAMRVGGRMLPHLGLGAFMAGKGATLIAQGDGEGPFYPEMANRAAGLGMIGAGTGLAEQGIRYGVAPGVAPDAKSIAIIESNMLRRQPQNRMLDSPDGPRPDAPQDVPNRPTPPADTPPDQTPQQRPNKTRAVEAAKAAGAKGIRTKEQAIAWLEKPGNITAQNRAAVVAALGEDASRNLPRALARVKLPGASMIFAPIVGGAIGYDMAASDARAAGGDRSDRVTSGLTGAAIGAGATAGGIYAAEKAAPVINRMLGKAIPIAGSAMAPLAMDDLYGLDAAFDPDNPDPEAADRLAKMRHQVATTVPSWARVGALEDAYQMAQVPERNPMRVDAQTIAADREAQAQRMPMSTAASLEIPSDIPSPRPDGSSPYGQPGASGDDFDSQLADLSAIMAEIDRGRAPIAVASRATERYPAPEPMRFDPAPVPQNRLSAAYPY